MEECGGVLAELNAKGAFGVASTYACLAVADWEGNREGVEGWVGLWEVSFCLFWFWFNLVWSSFLGEGFGGRVRFVRVGVWVWWRGSYCFCISV